MLDNREISFAVWLTLFAIWAFSKAEIRKSCVHVIKAMLKWKILLSVSLMGAYIASIAIVFNPIVPWNTDNLKTITTWSFTSALVMLVKVGEVPDDAQYFQKAILAGFKTSVVLEFIANLYVFNLFIELLLVPVAATLSCLLAVAEYKEEFKPVRPVLNTLSAILGLGLLIYFIYCIYTDYRSFFQAKTIVEFFLPFALTLFFLPYLYILATYASYESLFIRFKWLFNDAELRRFTKFQLLRHFGFNFHGLNKWAKRMTSARPSTKEQVVASLQRS